MLLITITNILHSSVYTSDISISNKFVSNMSLKVCTGNFFKFYGLFCMKLLRECLSSVQFNVHQHNKKMKIKIKIKYI